MYLPSLHPGPAKMSLSKRPTYKNVGRPIHIMITRVLFVVRPITFHGLGSACRVISELYNCDLYTRMLFF